MLQKFKDVLHYLDDFFAVLPTLEVANHFNYIFDELCHDLGIAINYDKDLTGTTVDFLGIELDTILMQARLLSDKLQEAKNRVETALQKSSLSRDELRSLVGFLSFAAKVVIPGRAFLRRLFNELTKTQNAFLHINHHIKADLL